MVVLDLNLPDVNGLDGVVRMRQARADIPIVVVSSLDDLRVVRGALRAGATAFLPRHAEREELCEAFSAIARGEVQSSRKLLENAPATPLDEAGQLLVLLTRQQPQFLRLICSGLMNKQIVYEMIIAETTVKAHVTAIMRKLVVPTRMQTVLLANDASFQALSPET